MAHESLYHPHLEHLDYRDVSMQKSFMRIPYTGPLPPPTIIPASASSLNGAISALASFLRPSPRIFNPKTREITSPQTVLLTGAGISVASGLADYRGEGGTYTLNKTYRPIYYHEFCSNHEARKRYWARSFLGWTSLHRARPNASHWAIKSLGDMGIVRNVITQNVDSFHLKAHPDLSTLELHGYLRSLACINCRTHLPRDVFQASLSALNPTWAAFLAELLATGALDTENPSERRAKGLRTNPDGDVDLPEAPYTTFRYPACPTCFANPPSLKDGTKARVEVDDDGAWKAGSEAGILKPAVVMFGESIADEVKVGAEQMVDAADHMLVMGSSLATYSAWRLMKRAKERGMRLAVVNLGGVRGEEGFFGSGAADGDVRISRKAEELLPGVLQALEGRPYR